GVLLRDGRSPEQQRRQPDDRLRPEEIHRWKSAGALVADESRSGVLSARGPASRMSEPQELRVAVVDDEAPARDELCFLLQQMSGIEIVAQAGNGVEALRVIEEYQPDLVMLDVQMPGLTGFEVARRVVEAGLETQVVFVTAFD